MDIEKGSEGLIKQELLMLLNLGTQTGGTQGGWFTKSLTSSQKSAQDFNKNY